MIRGEYLYVGGVRTFVESAGQGAPVLLLHSAGQSALQWRRVLEQLPELGYRGFAPDLPGHGRSGGTSQPVEDLHLYGEWCRELIDVAELQRPYVVGCSIGGKIALDLGVHHGHRLGGIVVCAADARNRYLSPDALRRTLDDAGSPSRTDRTELGTYAAVGTSVPPDLAREIVDLHRREDPVVTTHDLIGWASQDLRGELGRVSCPTHVVAGAEDFWVDLDDARATAARIPHARLTILSGVGHYPMEELDDFGHRIAEWLAAMADQLGTR